MHHSAEPEKAENYYDFLQISPKAQAETIQRVYRFLAARYHPDNGETGDPEKFVLLNQAYKVLSDPERRTQYDSGLKKDQPQPSQVFDSIDFFDGIEGEVNRRLAVLALLYRHCRANVHNSHVSLLDVEAQMGFPREYLDFAVWYLRSKKYVKQEDNAELALTVLGVDYIEENYEKIPLLRKLLNAGSLPPEYSRKQTTDKAPNRRNGIYVLSAGETASEEIDEA